MVDIIAIIKDIFNSKNINNLYNKIIPTPDYDYKLTFKISIYALSILNFVIALLISAAMITIRLIFEHNDLFSEFILVFSFFMMFVIWQPRKILEAYKVLKIKCSRLNDLDREYMIQPKFMKWLWLRIAFAIVWQFVSLFLAYILLNATAGVKVAIKIPEFINSNNKIALFISTVILLVELMMMFALVVFKKNRYKLVKLITLRVEKYGLIKDIFIDSTRTIDLKDGMVYIYEAKGTMEYAFSQNYLLDISIDYKVESL